MATRFSCPLRDSATARVSTLLARAAITGRVCSARVAQTTCATSFSTRLTSTRAPTTSATGGEVSGLWAPKIKSIIRNQKQRTKPNPNTFSGCPFVSIISSERTNRTRRTLPIV